LHDRGLLFTEEVSKQGSDDGFHTTAEHDDRYIIGPTLL
jgi:hypothetical protein